MTPIPAPSALAFANTDPDSDKPLLALLTVNTVNTVNEHPTTNSNNSATTTTNNNNNINANNNDHHKLPLHHRLPYPNLVRYHSDFPDHAFGPASANTPAVLDDHTAPLGSTAPLDFLDSDPALPPPPPPPLSHHHIHNHGKRPRSSTEPAVENSHDDQHDPGNQGCDNSNSTGCACACAMLNAATVAAVAAAAAAQAAQTAAKLRKCCGGNCKCPAGQCRCPQIAVPAGMYQCSIPVHHHFENLVPSQSQTPTSQYVNQLSSSIAKSFASVLSAQTAVPHNPSPCCNSDNGHPPNPDRPSSCSNGNAVARRGNNARLHVHQQLFVAAETQHSTVPKSMEPATTVTANSIPSATVADGNNYCNNADNAFVNHEASTDPGTIPSSHCNGSNLVQTHTDANQSENCNGNVNGNQSPHHNLHPSQQQQQEPLQPLQLGPEPFPGRSQSSPQFPTLDPTEILAAALAQTHPSITSPHQSLPNLHISQSPCPNPSSCTRPALGTINCNTQPSKCTTTSTVAPTSSTNIPPNTNIADSTTVDTTTVDTTVNITSNNTSNTNNVTINTNRTSIVTNNRRLPNATTNNPRSSSTQRERPYACDTCKRTFLFKQNRDRHIIEVHLGHRPHKCPHPSCEAAFKNLSGLKQHQKTVHEKARPFKCEKCPSAFGQRNHLRQHVLVVHDKIKMFQCEVCGMSFSNVGNRTQHLKRRHGHLIEPKKSYGRSRGRSQSQPQLRIQASQLPAQTLPQSPAQPPAQPIKSLAQPPAQSSASAQQPAQTSIQSHTQQMQPQTQPPAQTEPLTQSKSQAQAPHPPKPQIQSKQTTKQQNGKVEVARTSSSPRQQSSPQSSSVSPPTANAVNETRDKPMASSQ